MALRVWTIMTQDAPGSRDHPQRVAFGARLRELRLAKSFSQEDLADLAHMHRTYMSGVERGLRNVSLDNIWALADALEVSPAEFFKPRADQ